MKQPDRIAAAAHASQQVVRQSFFGFEYLPSGLSPYDALKIPDHHRVRMRPENRPKQIVRIGYVGDPVSKRFVDGVLERPAACFDRDDLGTEKTHPKNVQFLASHVLGTH